MEQEIREEVKQDDDKIEHVELDVAAFASSVGRPRRKVPSKNASQGPEVIDPHVIEIDKPIEEILSVPVGRARRKATSKIASQGPEVLDPDVVKIAKSIGQRLPRSTRSPGPKVPNRIYQVPRVLRQEDGSSYIYEPQLISIGPYHRGKIGLQPMEEKKIQHLKNFLSRNINVKLQAYIEGITKLEQRARKCYSQSISKITKNEFVEMMLLDGCFLVDIFLQNAIKDDDFPAIYYETWLQDFISHDMLLLENQLPYFILTCIFKLHVGDQKVSSMAELALRCFKYIPVIPLNHGASMNSDYNHLVHLFHHHCLPTTDDGADEGSDGGGEMDSSIKAKFVRLVDSVTSFFSRRPEMHLDQPLPLHAPRARVIDSQRKRASTPKQGSKTKIGKHPKVAVIDCWKKIAGPVKAVIDRATSFFRSSHEEMPSDKSDQQEPQRSIPSAEELEEAGVVFKPMKKKKNKGSFLHIEFHENGVIEIPYFNFFDGLDSVFQNFIAFEQCLYPCANTFFMGYAIFMDCLINTDKDVKILRRSGVLNVEGLGSDIELANVFNRMTRGVFWDAPDTRFTELYKGINDYCRKKRNVWRANLMHNYFNTPWSFLSFVAALVLLILTMTQTFFSIFPRN